MADSKLKGFTQKLRVFKDYSSLFIAGGIALAAVLLLILTPLLMGSSLKKQIESQSVANAKRVDRLSQGVPAGAQWQVEQQYVKAFENDANQIALLAKHSTERVLLSYKIFPDPKDVSWLIYKEFGQRYRNGIDGWVKRLNGGESPTAAELQEHLESFKARRYRGRRIPLRISSMNLSEIDREIKDAICRERAEAISVYVNPEDLAGYGFWENYEYTGKKESVEDCWYWQLGYWITEDVMATVASMNSGSTSVLEAPVKRIIAVSFDRFDSNKSRRQRTRSTRKLTGRSSRLGKAGRPSYVIGPQDGITESLTKRVCDDDLDVVHFNVVVIVSSDAVFPFMDELCSAKEHKFRGFGGNEPEQTFKHNQITVLESQVNPVDREDEQHSLYRYGENAVVELNLICEYIFEKAGYEKIKPESVKQWIKDQKEAMATVGTRGRRGRSPMLRGK